MPVTSRQIASVLTAALLLSCGPCFATATLTLAWAPSDMAGLGGYRVYEGSASQNYTFMQDVGTATNATISGLLPGTTYYFTVTDYDINGLESLFATEISYTVPPVVPTLSVTLNQSRQVVLSGSAPPGYVYEVQARPFPNSSGWTVIGSVTVDSNNSFQFTDTTGMTNQVQFYRLHQTYP